MGEGGVSMICFYSLRANSFVRCSYEFSMVECVLYWIECQVPVSKPLAYFQAILW